jgi:hypothetical protein
MARSAPSLGDEEPNAVTRPRPEDLWRIRVYRYVHDLQHGMPSRYIPFNCDSGMSWKSVGMFSRRAVRIAPRIHGACMGEL